MFTDYLKQKGYSQSSRITYQKIVDAFLDWAADRNIDMEYVSYSELTDYLQILRKRKLSQRTVQGYVQALNHYFDWLTSEQVIEKNPVKSLTIKTRKTRTLYAILSKEQLEDLHENYDLRPPAKTTKSSARASAIRNKIATGLMVYQGLEVSALARLMKEDVNLLEGTIKIRSSRTSNQRILALQAKQIIELDRYIMETRKELQMYFDQSDNRESQASSQLLLIHGYTHYSDAHRRLIQSLQKQSRSGLQSGLSTQQIRTSVITHWLKTNNLREVQYMAGHKQVSSTEAYRQNDTESLQLDIDRFHPFR